MRTGAARAAEYRELAAALREDLRSLPVRVLDEDDRDWRRGHVVPPEQRRQAPAQ